jgi:hypothetical protein
MQENIFGFFDSKDGDRKYSAADFVGFFADFFTNGIVADSTTYLQVKADSGMALSVNSGKAYINGGFFKPQVPTTLTLPDSDTTYPRYDLVVLRWDKILRSIYLDVVSGVGVEAPTVPALTRNETTYELGLASIYIEANATEITQANITDLRFNNNYCGVVTNVIDTIDTTALFAQYEKAWYDFVAQLPAADPDRITINTADEQARADIADLETAVTDINTRIPFKILTGVLSNPYRVTFSEPFNTVPVIAGSIDPQNSNWNVTTTFTVESVTETGFEARVRVCDSGGSSSGSGTIHWIAIGT